MDAYFTAQPDAEKEIPPLSFELYKVRENKLILGALLEEYPDAVRAMELNEIHLMADEDRRMILYHTSKSVVMIGNSSHVSRYSTASVSGMSFISCPRTGAMSWKYITLR